MSHRWARDQGRRHHSRRNDSSTWYFSDWTNMGHDVKWYCRFMDQCSHVINFWKCLQAIFKLEVLPGGQAELNLTFRLPSASQVIYILCSPSPCSSAPHTSPLSSLRWPMWMNCKVICEQKSCFLCRHWPIQCEGNDHRPHIWCVHCTDPEDGILLNSVTPVIRCTILVANVQPVCIVAHPHEVLVHICICEAFPPTVGLTLSFFCNPVVDCVV